MARITQLWTAHVQGDGARVVVARPAPADADYLVKTANGNLSAERVVTDTATVTWDWSTPGQAKATASGSGITQLTGDVTAGPGSGSQAATVVKARGLRETSGPTTLTMGAVADGQTLKRVGSTVVGAWIALAYATAPMVEIDAPGSLLGSYTTAAGAVA